MIILFLLLSLLSPATAPRTFQTFNILGTVRDNTGQGLNALRVSLLDDNYSPIRSVFSDTSGRFQFRGLVSGRYLLRVEPGGKPFEEQTVQLDLQAIRARGGGNEPFPVEIVLKRKKDAPPTDQPGTVFAQKIPDTARVEYERGANSIKDNKQELGIASLKKAIEIFPDYYLALELLGTEYVKRGEYDQAVPVLTHALEINQTAPKSLYAIGVAHLKLKRMPEAIESLKKATEMEPNNINAYMMLGIALGNNGQLGDAEVAFKKAYQLGGDQVADAHLYLAGVYNKQEKYNDAVRELELYLKEAKDLKDRAPIKTMIDKLKEKQKAKGKN
ncbi:MAG TPA: tetratricopeptide repeat protein [Blastocatellia bacterium]|nr:tetratricopeptide repeat protein [Blastocatellia bacterium]